MFLDALAARTLAERAAFYEPLVKEGEKTRLYAIADRDHFGFEAVDVETGTHHLIAYSDIPKGTVFYALAPLTV